MLVLVVGDAVGFVDFIAKGNEIYGCAGLIASAEVGVNET